MTRDIFASRAYREFRKTTIFGSLDGLRALSILAVIWHHAGTPNTSLRLFNRGFLGVDLFFVISGFLIVTLLLREQSCLGEMSLKKFYILQDRGKSITTSIHGQLIKQNDLD